MTPNEQLLANYLQNGDEEAFRELVARYIDLVHSTALRQVDRDEALAADVVQVVFMDLARLGRGLAPGTMLGGWLHRHTCFITSKIRRAEQRRKLRERIAAEMNDLSFNSDTQGDGLSSKLDDAINHLKSADRALILQRFFECRSLRAIGETLRISDDAAQKKVARAVEKLRALLSMGGVVVPAGILFGVLTSKAVSPAPVTLAAATASAVMRSAVTEPSVMAFLKLIVMTKLKSAILGLLIASFATTLVVRHSHVRAERQAIAFPTVEPSRSARPTKISAITRSTKPSSTLDSIPQPSPVDEAIERLRIGLKSGDAGTLSSALSDFRGTMARTVEAEKIRYRKAIPVLVEFWSSITNLPSSFDLPDLKSRTVSLLDLLKPATEEVMDIYIACLSDPALDFGVIGDILYAGPVAAKAVPALIAQSRRHYRVDDTDWRGSAIARMSLEALANIGPAASEAVPLLKEYLSDTNMMYRVIGARAYWNITGDAGSTLPVLIHALTNESSFWAADILKEMGPAASPALEALRVSYKTGAPDVRLRSYQALVSLDSGNPPDPLGVVDLLTTPSYITQVGAAQALWTGFHEPDQILPCLTEMVANIIKTAGDNYYSTLYDAVKILGDIGPAALSVLPDFRRLIENPKGMGIEQRSAISNAWIQIAPNLPVPTVHE